MRKKHWTLGLFCLLAVIQIAVPVSMLVRREITLRTGKQFKFKVTSVDFSDAIPGRYVALSFKGDQVTLPEGMRIFEGQSVYALFENDENGFACFKSVSRMRPKGGNYIKATVKKSGSKEATLSLPFDRFYLEEEIAPPVRKACCKYSEEKKCSGFTTVRVKSGLAVLEEVYIDDLSIKDFIKKNIDRFEK
ncbi:MAG: GDYXXLXY domain-containing protein [Acidobacteriota bacterium]